MVELRPQLAFQRLGGRRGRQPDDLGLDRLEGEKGVHHRRDRDLADEGTALRSDLDHPVLGLLTESLRRRRLAWPAPFAVRSCDNLPDDGAFLRAGGDIRPFAFAVAASIR